MSPKVSVVMSVFNGEVYLAEAIDSILNQTFSDFEFIIVDDGSTDSSANIIQLFTDSRIQLISLDKNMGLASALNHGVNQAQGQYIARMDSDDISLPSRFQEQVNYMDAHSDVIVLGTQMQVVDADKNPLFDFDVPLQHSLIVWNLFFGRTFAHPSVMMRRNVLVQVGVYDESISTAQDVDLWSRLIGQGRFANLADQLILYRTHEKATSIQKASQQKNVLHITLKRLLMQLWGDDASDETVARFLKIRSGKFTFTKTEYGQVVEETHRLAVSMIAQNWILPEEWHLIDDDIKRLDDHIKPHYPLWKRLLNRISL
jgi:glycosyltransferase involved in cell wall biosynthesis